MSHTKIRALQQWCKALVDGYKDVNITNMSSSWRDGLAFCALIHRFRPDLINFDALSKSNVLDNNQLAFTVAESIGIPALLEAKDMYDLPVPDKLSVITYVASMHNYFKDKEKLGGPGVSSYKGGNIQIGTKRHQDNDPLNITEPKRSTPDQSEERNKKIGSSPTRQRSPADDLCTLCQGKVYLIEKQIENGKLYHRSCFRGSHMSPASKILSKNLSNGAGYITATINDDHSLRETQAKVEQTANLTTGDNSKSQAKVRLYEKKKEQIQKAEEKLKAEKQKEKELYEKRQNAPSALRNHLKNMDNQTKENSKSSSGSLASRSSESHLFAKPSSPERDLTKPQNTTEQPSWAQTKLRKVFDDPVSSSPTAVSLGKVASSRRDSSSCAAEKPSRESSPGSPVLMQQVTSRTMEDRQYRASRSVTKSSTNLEAESGKQQLVSGLLKSLANVRQRPGPANTASPTSPPLPSPKLPSVPPPFSKLSAAPVPTATNGLSFGQPLNSTTPAQPVLTSTPLQAKTNDVKMQTPAKTMAPVAQKEQTKSVARIKTVIKSTPSNPAAATTMTPPSTVVPVSTTSALSAKSKVTNGTVSPSESLTKPVASINATKTSPPHLVSSTKSNITSHSSLSNSASSAKTNVSKMTSETSLSHSASPKSNISNISKTSSESSPSHPASPAKSNISKITSESSLSRSASPKSNISNVSKITSENSASPAKSNVSKITSESSLSRSASPKSNTSNVSKISSESSASHGKSNVSKITSESSLSRSASPKSNISNVSKITSKSSPSHSASPAKSNVSKITSESSLSRSVSPKSNISNVSKISSESSLSHSASSTRSNLSKITAPLQITSPTKSALSKATVDTSSISTSTTDKISKDDKPQSLLERIQQYSKVAAGVEKPPTELSPTRELILANSNPDKQDRRSSLKQNEFTTTSTPTSIAVKKPLASESTKERNTVSRHIATPKKVDNKPETVCMPAPVVKTYDKNGHVSSKAEITKGVKPPSVASNSVSQTQPNKSSMTAPSPKRLVKKVENNTNSTTNSTANANANAVSTSGVFSIGLTKLHPAHYSPNSSDSSPNSNSVSPNTTTNISLDMRVNPIPKPKRQKPGLIPSTTKENKENPVENKLSHSNGANSPKTTGALCERQESGDDSKTEWQREAERRIAARRGKYVDPETHVTRFMLPDSTTRLDNEKNGDANQNTKPVGLKKISVAQNWTFNSDDSLNSNTSLDFPYRKQIMPKQDLDSLEWSNPKKRLSTDEIQKELTDIDSKLTDLELRGRQLEVSIRADLIEFSDDLPCDTVDSVLQLDICNLDSNEDDEKFMVEWFQLINEKNELVRRENDLIYQSQEQELEEEQIRIDKELQTLLMKPYEKKSKAEKKKEEALIQQKIAVVNQRNLIVDSIDEDRLRYKEEDEGIKEVLQSKGYLKTESPY